jgi:alcohol dehydrogenase class IV
MRTSKTVYATLKEAVEAYVEAKEKAFNPKTDSFAISRALKVIDQCKKDLRKHGMTDKEIRRL